MQKRKTDLVVTGFIFNQENQMLLIHHKKLDLWLPPGGHIDPNETPDEAILREIDEETGLKVILLNQSQIIPTGNTKMHLALPFNVNVHSVGDHDHCTFNYICKSVSSEIIPKKDEILGYKWVSRAELFDDSIPKDIRQVSLIAFQLANNNI